MADQETFDRVAAEWGTTAEDVEATWRAGWDITQGPPPAEFAGKHALPPEDAVIDPTHANPVFHNDLYPGHSAEALDAAKEQASSAHANVLEGKRVADEQLRAEQEGDDR